jgi:hypothetical protein
MGVAMSSMFKILREYKYTSQVQSVQRKNERERLTIINNTDVTV